jgi:hypothetical protein
MVKVSIEVRSGDAHFNVSRPPAKSLLRGACYDRYVTGVYTQRREH